MERQPSARERARASSVHIGSYATHVNLRSRRHVIATRTDVLGRGAAGQNTWARAYFRGGNFQFDRTLRARVGPGAPAAPGPGPGPGCGRHVTRTRRKTAVSG